MSIELMTKVIQRAPVSGSAFTCMLLMANWANDDGDSLYPSIALLAEAMRVSRSQAQRILHSLMPPEGDDGSDGNWWFRVVGNERGGAPGMTRRYEMNVARLDDFPKLPEFEKADERRRQKAETGRIHATGRMDATGSAHATPRVAPMRPDSSEDSSLERERVREMDEKQVLQPEARTELDPVDTVAFDSALRAWPSGFADSRDEALREWRKLRPEDRALAAEEIHRFVRTTKSVGRSHFCGFAGYLRERRWEALPPRPAAAVLKRAKAEGPPQPIKVKPTAFQRENPHLYPEIFGGGSTVPSGPGRGA